MQTKLDRLRAISTPEGIIAAVAMDQRSSLRRMLARACGLAEEAISDTQLSEFKTAVSAELTPLASAILLDPEYGLPAAPHRAVNCGLLLTYESDGFENPRPHRMLALMPQQNVRRLRDEGAAAIKILLSWAPDDDPLANDEKCVLVERIGNECAALDMPFLLEPVVYDPAQPDVKSRDYVRAKPELVLRTIAEFSETKYRVDILKVEFPVNAALVESSPLLAGTPVFSRQEAEDWYRRVDAAASVPYIYLSAGINIHEFVTSLELAGESGARFSGVLCGRATWQDGVAFWAQSGEGALREWLRTKGVANLQRIDRGLKAATPWHQRTRELRA